MKQIFFIAMAAFLVSFTTVSQSPSTTSGDITFKLRNNSLFPAKVSVISYRPDEKGNGTTAFVVMPYGTKTYKFPIGTKIYLANQKQVNTVMSGTKISDQSPFLTVKKEDNNKTFNINN
jgi:hypothetical protein